MTVFLVVVSLYGGITTLPMNSMATCETAAKKFTHWDGSRVSQAYCVKNGP